jgi:type III secretion protein J
MDWRKQAKIVGLALCLVLAGCGRAELYSKLSETQVNEMIAVLQSAGISSSKQNEGENGWTLTTAKGDFGKAVQLLRAQGYPRADFASLGTVFKKEGFVSSPTEERARLIYGLNEELSHTISEIDGVVQARVQLALPQNQPLADPDKQTPPSASVFIKYRPGANIDAQVGKVKALVVNSVEGLKIDNVSVETFPSQDLPVAQPGASGGIVSANLAALVLPVLLLIALWIGYPAIRRWHQRRAVLMPPAERKG